MRTVGSPPAESPPQRLFLQLAPAFDEESMAGWLKQSLGALNWRAQLFLVGDGGPRQWAQIDRLLPVMVDHLDEHRLTNLSLHPLVTVAGLADVDGVRRWWLFDVARRFQAEAYREQSEARLAVHPVFAPIPGAPPEVVRAALRLAHAELATPCLLLPSDPPTFYLEIPELAETRLYFRMDPQNGPSGVLATLRAHHVVESVLDRIENGAADLLVPCRSHLVVDAAITRVSRCLHAWQRDGPWRSPQGGRGQQAVAAPGVSGADCPACILASALSAVRALDLGGRRGEAQQLCFRLGLALSAVGDHDGAAALARHAVELARTADDRAAAQVHRGLSLLELGRLADADEALLAAARCGADPGLVAYHRGRVQLAWPDEIEALERFQEAAAARSAHVPPHDLHLEMALAHIRLGEYVDARPHIELAATDDNGAVIEFLRGVCALNEGALESALAHFHGALERRPAPDDLGRVLLYLATSLSELDRFEDAIRYLERAVAVEPDELAHHNLLGYCHYRLGRHAEAVACFRRAVALDPSSALDWANLGSNLRELGRADEAIAAYRRALELDPTIDFAADNLKRLVRA